MSSSSSSRKRQHDNMAGLQKRPAKKKQKRARRQALWTQYTSIPPPPAVPALATLPTPLEWMELPAVYDQLTKHTRDSQYRERDEYIVKLSRSVVYAVEHNSLDFITRVFANPQMRSMLCLEEHAPLNEPPGNFPPNFMQRAGISLPIQPNFGYGDLIYRAPTGPGALSSYTPVAWPAHGPPPPLPPLPPTTRYNQNLLALACKYGHLEIIRKLVGLGFNPSSNSKPRSSRDITNPLIAAIEHDQPKAVKLLLELAEPNLILTHLDNTHRIFWNRNQRCRHRCDPTALSIAAKRGQTQIVAWLVEHGACDRYSTSRLDDPYSHEKYNLDRADEMTRLSVNEAIYEAYNRSGPNRFYYSKQPPPPKQAYADILELLLTKTGSAVREKYSINVGILKRILERDWQNSRLNGYKYKPEDDDDFDNHGKPSVRAIAVARGLRHVSLETYLAATNGSPMTVYEQLQYQEKQWEWQKLILASRERLAEEPPAEPSAEAKSKWQWCRFFLQASQPWNRGNHDLFPKMCRQFVHSLLVVGSQLSKKHTLMGIRDVWETEILPFCLD